MATHSSILAWRIPWMEESGGLQSMSRKELDTTERLTHTALTSPVTGGCRASVNLYLLICKMGEGDTFLVGWV